MPNVRNLRHSFAGGEISPEMFGRIDDQKYQTGLAKCRNFVVTPQGPVENRAGFAFVREVKNSGLKVRLIPFTYSTTQTMVLEMGAGYFRFHTQGATLLSGGNPYEITNPYAEEDLFDIHYVQSADVLTLVHPKYRPMELRRLGATNWTLTAITFTYILSAPTSVTATASGHTTAKYTYKYIVTSVAADGIRESAASSVASASGNLYETGGIVTISWTAASDATRYNVYKLQGGLYGYIGQTGTVSLVDDNIAPDMSKTPPTVDTTFNVSGIASVGVNAQGNNYTSVPTGGAITGRTIASAGYLPHWMYSIANPPEHWIEDPTGFDAELTITWKNNVYKNWLTGEAFNCLSIDTVTIADGGFGYTDPKVKFGIEALPPYTGGPMYSAPSITLTKSAITAWPTTLKVNASAGSGAKLTPIISAGKITSVRVDDPGSGYVTPTVAIDNAGGGSGATFHAPVLQEAFRPAAVSYFEQRRCFAGTLDSPQQLWMTKSGTEADVTYSLPIKDNDRISVRVAAREANTIRHIVPLSQLLLLTSAAEWRVTSINSDAITPTSISVKPQSYVGASNVQPVIVNTNLIYAAARGGHIRECAYNWQANGFITGDVSLRASHLFDHFEIADMAYSKAPLPMLWFVSTSGDLLGFTYVPEQQIGAWHRHDTYRGAFESCTVVAEGNDDVLYVCVRRGVGGQVRRYIERLHTRGTQEARDGVFVDSALSYDGRNTSAIGVTVTGGTTWGPGENLTLTASAALFSHPGDADVGDEVVLGIENPPGIRLTIQSVSSTTVATVQADQTLPEMYRNISTDRWEFARREFAGLTHLEAREVAILADGAVHPRQVVEDGKITLDAPAAVVHVGIPIEAELQTLPLALQIDHAFGQGRQKNINHAWLRVYRSAGIWVGPDEDHLIEVKSRTDELYGSPPGLKTEELDVMLIPSWREGGSVCVKQVDPLPLTLSALTLEVSIGG